MQISLAPQRSPFYEPPVFWTVLLGSLAGLSAALGLWQWVAARRFPLHQRDTGPGQVAGVTMLKPLKGSDAFTERCLQSWFQQDCPGPVQLLFGIASEDDPVCETVRRLISLFPQADAQLVICPRSLGLNAKVSTLIQLYQHAKHPVVVVSDADVLVPADLLRTALTPMRDEKAGLVSCLYRLANPWTPAMRWEAVAINADFWSQVLQSNMLKPMDFALGAVMLARRTALEAAGGFEGLANCLADDYLLGNRIARQGYRVAVCPVVVECWDPPQGWGAVWKHQLRWARTIRVCQPLPYFFSILNVASLWPLLWAAVLPSGISLMAAVALVGLRILVAWDLLRRLTPDRSQVRMLWMVPVKDLLQVAVWFAAFLGNTIEWRGQRLRLRRDGTLVPLR